MSKNKKDNYLPDVPEVKQLIKSLLRQRKEYADLILSLREKHREADKLLKELRKASSVMQKKVMKKIE